MSDPRVLLVAHRTATEPALLEAVARRAAAGPCTFTLLVPREGHGLHRVVDPEDHGWREAEEVIARATPRLAEAAGAPVAAMVGSHDPLAAVQDALNLRGFDEIILSTLPHRVSQWLRIDLPHKVAALGVPLTLVSATTPATALSGQAA
jgi:hypothetical protein